MKKDRKKIARKYRYYKKLIDAEKYSYVDNVFLNEKGQAILQLNVEKYNNVVSDYCMPNYEIFDEAFAEFIIDNVEYIDMQHDLVIEMYFNDELNENQQSIVKKTLKRHFAERIASAKSDVSDSYKKTGVFTLIGALILLFSTILTTFKVIPILTEVIYIGAWFFLWEAIENIFSNTMELKGRMITDARIWNAEIVIKKLNETYTSTNNSKPITVDENIEKLKSVTEIKND